MKICQQCGQAVAQEVARCPVCGGDVGKGLQCIDNYIISKVIHEGNASILCKAVKRGDGEEDAVMLRIFTKDSGVDDAVAARLKSELAELQKLPQETFIRHQAINQSTEGLWYRVSEWVEGIHWGDVIASGRLKESRVLLDLFHQMASGLAILHDRGLLIPHLILDDLILVEDKPGKLHLKIDYKLSRFLSPRQSNARPMLKNLLDTHPDIRDERPLDFRSDIWSLGKVFVEIVTADFGIHKLIDQIEKLCLPYEIEVLLKTMVAEDPDLRPGSMQEIVDNLSTFMGKGKKEHQIICSDGSADQQRLKSRTNIFFGVAALLVMIILFLGVLVFLSNQKKDETLVDIANKYAASVGFVVVDYWLEMDSEKLYSNRTEGTAFLVDEEGYMLTNRHVACPWLEDGNLFLTIAKFRHNIESMKVNHNIYMWFEGEKAFFRSPEYEDSSEVEDIYHLENAYGGTLGAKLEIAGVARTPVAMDTIIKAPLKDDFAILKIDPVPENLLALPLDPDIENINIPRLFPVITLGFPLGSQTQVLTVNVSVTQGNVRRSFENLLQVDTSIHRGNSGGPIIGANGKVIGIASGVAMERATGPLPVMTALSDIGMVLPINKAVHFLDELKQGKTKWNGVLDLSIEKRIDQIKTNAKEGKWQAAVDIAQTGLAESRDPRLFMFSAMMSFCAGEWNQARDSFEKALSVDSNNNQAQLMIYIIDWLKEYQGPPTPQNSLLNLDWRSPDEFIGFLATIIDNQVAVKWVERGWDNQNERSWIQYIIGLQHVKQGDYSSAEKILKEVALMADIGEWVFYLSRGTLDQIQKKRLERMKIKKYRKSYQTKIETFRGRLDQSYVEKSELRDEIMPLLIKLAQNGIEIDEKKEILENMLAFEDDNGEILTGLAFYHAMDEKWDNALEYVRLYLNKEGRENANRLSLGLLEAGILLNMGRTEEVDESLKAFLQRTKDPWYRSITTCLMENRSWESLALEAEENPQNLITAHTAFGLWAEGQSNISKAKKHYKEALGSYLDNWLEYDFAKERIKRIKKEQ